MTRELEPTKVDPNSTAIIRFRYFLNSVGLDARKEMESGFLTGTLFQLLVDDYLAKQFPEHLILSEWRLAELLNNLENPPIASRLHIHHVNKDSFFMGTFGTIMRFGIPDDLIFKESQPNHYRLTHIVESKLRKREGIPRPTRAFFNILKADGKPLIDSILTTHLKRESHFIPSKGYRGNYLRVVPDQEGRRETWKTKVLPYTREQINQLVEKIVEGTLN